MLIRLSSLPCWGKWRKAPKQIMKNTMAIKYNINFSFFLIASSELYLYQNMRKFTYTFVKIWWLDTQNLLCKRHTQQQQTFSIIFISIDFTFSRSCLRVWFDSIILGKKIKHRLYTELTCMILQIRHPKWRTKMLTSSPGDYIVQIQSKYKKSNKHWEQGCKS